MVSRRLWTWFSNRCFSATSSWFSRTSAFLPSRMRWCASPVASQWGQASPVVGFGGSTVGEALNILEGFDLSGDRTLALHRFLEASKLAFADRNAFLGDSDFVDVPLAALLSDEFACQRRALISDTALPAPQPPGDPAQGCAPGDGTDGLESAEGPSTTHLTVSDRWGNVVSYTFTIEQTGGSGIVVPDRGFLLNNELTDFEPDPDHPANAPAGGKRPRSSMSPTIVLSDGEPVVALGSPGGARIITTVLQLLVNQVDFGMTLPEAIAAPRLSNLNGPATLAENAFLATPEADALEGRGHAFSGTGAIGNVTGVAFLPDGRVQAAAEPERLGGGSAMVVRPAP